MSTRFDIIVIGAGIVGCMIARALSRFRLSIGLLDRANDVGTGASGSNSAIIHSGHDPVPGTNKAILNRRGNELWRLRIAEELDVPFVQTGCLVVALGAGELPPLERLYKRGMENKIEGIQILGRDAALAREPLLAPEVSAALWTPTAGVVDPFAGTYAAAQNAVANGATIVLDTEVRGLLVEEGVIEGVATSRGDFQADWVINSAGTHSDEIMHMAGDHRELEISPRKGEYFIFDPARIRLSNVIFPLPTEKGKGILVTATVHGNVMIGANAEDIGDKDDTTMSRNGMEEILMGARRLVPSLDKRAIIAGFAGVRATGNWHKDFLIERSASVKGLINLCGIDSPGYASAPAIAERIEEILKDSGAHLVEKERWNPRRTSAPSFKKLSHQQRAGLIRAEPLYGRIVCRCEYVTEGEVVAAIHSAVPARSYDAVKRRCWMGTGRCQGGFDIPRVLEILSRELDVPMTEVTKQGRGSEYLHRRTKDQPTAVEHQAAAVSDNGASCATTT
jgi:glycerol-3-phosphate dehydrogenase